ncbi:MAG: hypothetical protein K2L25_04190 [Alphaproteobacteria bacterium]|nr:hypothetical protein [Alphaproteobacteria bacterium]
MFILKSKLLNMCGNKKNTLLSYLCLSTVLCIVSFCPACAKEYKHVANNRNYTTYNKPQEQFSDNKLNFKQNLYLGIGAGKSVFTFGKIKADYKDQADAWRAPGSFQKSEFASGESLSLQMFVGTQVTQNTRLDFTYLHYSNLSLKMKSHSLLPIDDKVTNYTDGYKFNKEPDISADATMLNIYYYLDRLIGTLKIRPYIGAGIGMAQNVMSDYTIFDGAAYIIPEMQGTVQKSGTPIRISNIKTRHKGSTVGNFAFSFELGASYNLTKNCIIDIFGRYVNLGSVESEGVVSTYSFFTSTSDDIPVGDAYNIGAPAGETTSYYPDWKEKGNLNIVDIGLKLRFLF